MQGLLQLSPGPPQGYFRYRVDISRLFAVFRHGEVEIVHDDVPSLLKSVSPSGSCFVPSSDAGHPQSSDRRREERLHPRVLPMLRIRLVAPPPKSREIVVRADALDRGKLLWLAHPDKTWLDVKAGDVLAGPNRVTETVESVRIFRAYWADDGTPITCGRDWLEGNC